MSLIDVPDLPGPRRTLCWKQNMHPPGAMWRCDRARGHKGMHSWELWARIRELEMAILPPMVTDDLLNMTKES